jgi:molybdopterin-guanine dinucleotide biosynthesis protein A
MMDIADRTQEPAKTALTGVILAGGDNRRMGGTPKALLPFPDEPLICRQLRVMKPICSELILVAKEPRQFLPVVDRSVRIITDYYPGKGPLGGMHAALSLARHDDVWVVACDMPFVSAEAAELMLARKRTSGRMAVIPFIGGSLRPLHGIYDRSCVEAILFAMGRKLYPMRSFLEKIPYERVDGSEFRKAGINTLFFLNVNTPEEYERALRMTALPGVGGIR